MSVKNGSKMNLGDDGVKELVIICDQFISPIRMNGHKTASCLLKGRGRGETHVTLIQEMNVNGRSHFVLTMSDQRHLN